MTEIRKADIPAFQEAHLESVCKVLGDTESGLTGTEIGHLLRQIGVADPHPNETKWRRLYDALAEQHNRDQHANKILSFIRHALDPVRYRGQRQLFEARRSDLNVILAFVGLRFAEDGRFVKVKRAATLTDAEARAARLRARLEQRGVHSDVLSYCRSELLEDNCFHAVLEATKSVAEKLRLLGGVDLDSGQLVDQVISGDDPLVRINSRATESERSEQRGFANLLRGMFGVFRNPTAHEPRLSWALSEEDALDLLALASYAHRRLDHATVRGSDSA